MNVTLLSLLLLCFPWLVIGQFSGKNPLRWFQNITTNLFSSSGNILLGGLFPINDLTANWSQNLGPNSIRCDSINPNGLGLALVMKYTVDEINATPHLLPNVTLGFEIFDTCRQSFIIVKPTMFFLTNGLSENVSVLCNYTDYNARAMAIIGPQTSEMVTIIGKLLGFFMMPQVSYGATSDTFSDKVQYPSFLRTVPSDQWQAAAIVDLLKKFSWNWVAVVGSEDEYGKQGQAEVSSLAADNSICVAYEGLIPVYSDPMPVVLDILDGIYNAKVGVVVVFALPNPSQIFFSQVIQRNMTGVWVASSAWALSDLVISLPNIASIGTVLGFTDNTQKLSLLTSYVTVLFTRMKEEREKGLLWKEDYFPMANPCPSCSNLSPNNISLITQPVLQRTAFNVYRAVYSVAYALHQLLDCNAASCQKGPSTIYPWQLLEVLRNVSFVIKGKRFQFDSDGNPNVGYDVLTWNWKNGTFNFTDIGQFYKTLKINQSLINWYTNSSEVPMSTCSADCESGQVRRVKGFQSCCFDCIDCKEGTFQNRTEDIQCTLCPQGQWSTVRSTNCTLPTFTFLSWSSYEALGLTVVAVTLIVCQGAVGLLFLHHRGTPLVCAAGGTLSILTLLGIIGGCASVFLFLGKPANVMCHLQQPLSAMFATVTLSTILGISLQIVCVMEFPEKTPTHLEMVRGPGSWLVVLACCGVQASLCGWFVQQGVSLSVYLSTLKINFVRKFLRCPVDPMVGLGLMLGYNCLLALLSFMCTFMAKKPSRQYNLARDVTFSTLFYCVVWVVFIPIYTGLDEKNKSVAQMVAILFSNTGLVAAYFLPKCYLLLRNPDLNTTEYFRIYLEATPPASEKDQDQ
uniref:Taste receptor type 1 member 3 n=1 Tax=Scleropages formosus TaxID=113540 RepID=A0A8C9REP6_SCLFO